MKRFTLVFRLFFRGRTMSVKLLAIELYKAQQKVSGLESELENPAAHNKEKIKNDLRLARAELKVLRNMLDGEKAAAAPKPAVPPAYRQSRW